MQVDPLERRTMWVEASQFGDFRDWSTGFGIEP